MHLFLKNIIKIYFIFLFLVPAISFAGNKNLADQPESLISIQLLSEKQFRNLQVSELPAKVFTDYKYQKLKPNEYYWFKLTFNNQYLFQDSYFIHANDFFAKIYLVQFFQNNYISKSVGGSLVPISNRSFKGFYKDKVEMKITDTNETVVYLKIERTGNLAYKFPTIHLVPADEYFYLKTKTDLIQSFFAGVIAILCLFNMVLFTLTREKLYLFYFIYAIIASLYFFFYYDYIEYFLFPTNPSINRLFFFSNTLSQGIYFFFLYHALKNQDIGNFRKWIFRYATVITTISLGDILFSVKEFGEAVFISDIMSVLSGITIFILFLLLIRRVTQTVKIVLAGSLFLAMGGGAAIIANFFAISQTHIYIYQTGFCIELLMFAIAINFSHYNERLTRIIKQLDLERIKTEKLEKEKEVEKLNKDIDKKNRDLTYKAILISQKETMQKDILKQLSAINKQDEIEKENLKQVISNLKSNINNNHWKEFEGHFTTVHPLFYSALNEKYPNLTANEYRLCAFLKMNLSSKEIAFITGKSQQSVDVARSRLRKKMGLKNHENISSVIAGIKSN